MIALGEFSACFASIMAPASRSDGSRWESGAAAARIKSVGVGHFDFTVPLLARVPGLWNTEECDAVLTTVRDAEWSPPRERAARQVIDERVRSNGGGDAAGVDRPHAAGLFQTCRWTEK
jgi:hypothetical protein